MANRGLNHLVLMGHLGADAKRINSSKGFGCMFNLATSRRYKKASGDWEDQTTWVRCSYWNAEKVFDYLKQGRQVVIEGHLQNFPYKDSGGKEIRLMEVAVDVLILTDYRAKNSDAETVDEEMSESESQHDMDEMPTMASDYKAYLDRRAAEEYDRITARETELAQRERELETRIAALSAALPVEGEKPRKREYMPSPTPPVQKRSPAARRGGRR